MISPILKRFIIFLKSLFPEVYRSTAREMEEDALFFCKMKIKFLKVKDTNLYKFYIRRINDGSIKYKVIYELAKKGYRLHKELMQKTK